MFKPSKASSVEEYLSLIAEPRKSEIINLHKFIQKNGMPIVEKEKMILFPKNG
jgi:hypothetical protein